MSASGDKWWSSVWGLVYDKVEFTVGAVAMERTVSWTWGIRPGLKARRTQSVGEEGTFSLCERDRSGQRMPRTVSGFLHARPLWAV